MPERLSTSEILELDLPDLFEVSAMLISILAMPGWTEPGKRDRLDLSLCSWFIRDHGERDPAWASQPQWIRPDQACRAEADRAKSAGKDLDVLGSHKGRYVWQTRPPNGLGADEKDGRVF